MSDTNRSGADQYSSSDIYGKDPSEIVEEKLRPTVEEAEILLWCLFRFQENDPDASLKDFLIKKM